MAKTLEHALATASLLVILVCSSARADLVALWDFNGDSVEDAWGDNHGLIHGTSYFTAGRPGAGRALELTGSEYATIANESNFDFTDAMTVAAWIKVHSFDKEWQAIIAKGNTAWRIQRNSTTNALEFACSGLDIPGGSQWGNLFGSQNVNDGQWHHVAGVYDGRKMYLYIDGLLDVSQDASGKVSLNDRPVCIGENGQDGERYFRGLIDDVAIFSHALSVEEIRRLQTQGPASFLPETRMDQLVKEAERTVATSPARNAVTALSERIAEYERWCEKNEDKTGLRDRRVSPDVYFFLAQARECAGLDPGEPDTQRRSVVAAYRQVVREVPYRTRHVADALVWLSEHLTADEYRAVVREFARGSRVLAWDLGETAGKFEGRGDWAVFERFLDALSVAVDFRGGPAYTWMPAVWTGLQADGPWADKFLEYCRGRPELTSYFFRQQEKLAQRLTERADYGKAAEVYRAIADRCGPNQDRATYEYRACECVFNANEFDRAIEVCDTFIRQYKPYNQALVSQAMMLQGRCRVNLGRIDEAVDTFFDLVVEYPRGNLVAEANFLMGYCLMLQGGFEDAAEALRLVAQDHPNSEYAPKATLYLSRIESMAK